MPSQHLSPARLTQAGNLDAFVQFLCLHGALGYGFDPQRFSQDLSEDQLLSILPLFFGLMPAPALLPPIRVGHPPIRPMVVERLKTLGIERDDLLEDILVAIADQYRSTVGNRYVLTGESKFGIREVRARRLAYRRLIERQGGRCVSCGVHFSGEDETLDHIIPWQFVGDVLDGSNWQLMCLACNAGKGDLISALQSPFAYNWLYKSTVDRIHQVSRYLALRRSRSCGYPRCGMTARETRLFALIDDARSVPSLDHLIVRCEIHHPDVLTGEHA